MSKEDLERPVSDAARLVQVREPQKGPELHALVVKVVKILSIRKMDTAIQHVNMTNPPCASMRQRAEPHHHGLSVDGKLGLLIEGVGELLAGFAADLKGAWWLVVFVDML